MPAPGKFASGEHIAKRVAEVSVDDASKGFLEQLQARLR